MGTGAETKDAAKQEHENEQLKKTLKIHCAAHKKRIDQCADDKAAAAALIWNRRDFPETKLDWNPRCKAGFPLGHFSASGSACFNHINFDGLTDARFVTDGTSHEPLTSNTQAGIVCVEFSFPHL